MVEYRKGETGVQIPSRSPRVFQKADGFWYFMTRENTEVGPFSTDEIASTGVQDYAGFSQDVDRVYLDDTSFPVGDGLADLLPAHTVVVMGDEPVSGERTLDTEETAAERRARFYSSRIFLREGDWYFFTREGRDIGPFKTRDDTEEALAKYVGFAADLDRVINEAVQEENNLDDKSGDLF